VVTIEEANLHVLGEAVEAEEPALALHPIEGGVPPHRLPDIGDEPDNHLVDLDSYPLLPLGHGIEVGLDGRRAIPLRDLGIAAGEELGGVGHAVRLRASSSWDVAAGPERRPEME
jgi:hypothetical protein